MSSQLSWTEKKFPGGAPPPLTGRATAPLFSKKIFFAKSTYFLIEDTLLMVLSAKKNSQVGWQGAEPPFSSSFGPY